MRHRVGSAAHGLCPPPAVAAVRVALVVVVLGCCGCEGGAGAPSRALVELGHLVAWYNAARPPRVATQPRGRVAGRRLRALLRWAEW